MREELLGPKVEGVGVAIVQEKGEDDTNVYNVYLLNLRDDIIEGIIVTSKGYGTNVETGEVVKTSLLRHCIELMLPNEASKLEPLMDDVLGLSNEFWVSFWINDVMYDKKFVFLAESVSEKNLRDIPVINAKGVMIM